MEENSRQDSEIKELRAIANTHVSWTVFWAVLVLLVGIFSGVVSFVLRDKDEAHDKIDDRLIKLEAQSQDAKVSYATIMTQLTQIQKEISELKTELTSHDKNVK